jgi:hypothetical protein
MIQKKKKKKNIEIEYGQYCCCVLTFNHSLLVWLCPNILPHLLSLKGNVSTHDNCPSTHALPEDITAVIYCWHQPSNCAIEIYAHALAVNSKMLQKMNFCISLPKGWCRRF